MSFSFNELAPSGVYSTILGIVGRRNRRDALQIDSAHKSGCDAFLSRDRKDIISKRAALEALLGIRFFHSDEDWDAFLAFVENEA